MSSIGVVGYGMGSYHCQNIPKIEGFELRAICDTDPARLKKAGGKHEVELYSTFSELINDTKVQLVVLATPHHIHAPMAIQALDAGRHVLVEKVMCLNVAEANSMIQASKRANRTLTVFQNRRLDSDFLTAREVMDSDILGEVYRIEVASNFYGPHEGWRRKKEFGGGYIYDAGAHVIDQLVQLAGCRATRVYSDTQSRIWTDTMDTETYAHITLRFESGLSAAIDISGIARYAKPKWILFGEKGTFVKQDWEGGLGYIYTSVADLSAKIEVEPKVGNWLDFYNRLSEHLLKGTELWVKPEEAREAIKIMEGAFRSAENDTLVDISEW